MYSGEIIQTRSGFMWKIKNPYITYKNVGEVLISSPFTISTINNEWQLELYPNGYTEESSDYLSLYLKIINGGPVTVSFKLSILNSKQEKVIKKGSFKVNDIFDGEDYSWGYSKFVKQSFIKDKRNDVLINGTLLILCEISLNFADVNDSNLCRKKRKVEKTCTCKLNVDLEKLFESGKFTDITFFVDGEEILVHKNILASRSSVFDAMFQSDMEEKKQNKVVIKDIKYAVLMELFRYMYTEEVHKINEVASDLLIAADKYCVEGLKLKCEKVLCDNITSNNVLEYLKLADVFSAPKLKSQAIEFITSHSKDIVEKPDFKTFADLHSNVICEVFRAMAHNK